MLATLLAFFKLSSRAPDQHIAQLTALMEQVCQASAAFVSFATLSDFSAMRLAEGPDGSVNPLAETLENRFRELRQMQKHIIDLERHADKLEKEATDSVSHALLLPFDRSFLFRLLNRADNIIDAIRSASTYSQMYKTPYSPTMMEMATKIHEATVSLMEITPLLSNVPRGAKALVKTVDQVRVLERDVDRLHLQQLNVLLSNVNPTKLAANPLMAGRYVPTKYEPMRECIDRIEGVMDACQDYAEAILIVVTDNA